MINIGHLSFYMGPLWRWFHLARNSQEFYLLQRIQDEVHRFAITFHRQLREKMPFNHYLMRSRELVKSERNHLLKDFGSVKKMKEATYRTDYISGNSTKYCQISPR